MHQALDRITLGDLLQHEGRLTELLRTRWPRRSLEPSDGRKVVVVSSVQGRRATDCLSRTNGVGRPLRCGLARGAHTEKSTMSTSNRTIEELANREYKAGFL